MSCVHNGLIRSLNSVYNQCINVAEQGTEKDKLDFANYALHCAELLHAHHTFEEETLFPGFNKLAGVPGLMDENVQEHEIFHAGFSAYKKYILEVQGKRVRLHGGRLRTLMDNFMPALYKHLVNEIDTLSAMERYEGVDFKKWFDKEVRRFHRVLIMQFNYNVSCIFQKHADDLIQLTRCSYMIDKDVAATPLSPRWILQRRNLEEIPAHAIYAFNGTTPSIHVPK